MNINDDKINGLLRTIEDVRRRKISDFNSSESISYIDPNNFINRLIASNNHVIQGRRGSGKTTLLLKRITEGTNEYSTIIDCQPIKNSDADIIILDIFKKLFKNITEELSFPSLKKIKSSVSLLNRLMKNFDKDKFNLYEKNKNKIYIINLLNLYINSLNRIRQLPPNITVRKTTDIKDAKSQRHSQKGKIKSDLSLRAKFSSPSINVAAAGLTDLASSYEMDTTNILEKRENIDLSSEQKFEILRKDIILDFKEKLVNVIDETYKLTHKKVVLFLDDYYLINDTSQVFIVQYLHDIYKLSKKSCFCFKMSVLPYRIKLNPDGNFDFSLKDDFSPIKLDYDLFDLENLKEHLLKIVSKLNSEIDLNPQDIRSIFSNEDVLNYSIIASGGIPRDFMVLLADIITNAKAFGRENIIKENVYNVVNALKDDKDQNIEVDSDIQPEVIRDKIEQITRKIVDKYRTNIFLYPKDRSVEEDNFLRNLVNLRYIHLIKENVSSETIKKKSFDAYLIDMIFYATGKRMSRDFNFRESWKKDEKQRLPHLHRAPILQFN